MFLTSSIIDLPLLLIASLEVKHYCLISIYLLFSRMFTPRRCMYIHLYMQQCFHIGEASQNWGGAHFLSAFTHHQVSILLKSMCFYYFSLRLFTKVTTRQAALPITVCAQQNSDFCLKWPFSQKL